jgi:ABC-type antimicrobial peptide transport system permease subunit
MAIGANQTGVLAMVMRQGMTLAGIGAIIGLVLWMVASRPVMMFVQASSFSWSLLAFVTAGLLAAAALGAYFPARRASQVDPNRVLRQD